MIAKLSIRDPDIIIKADEPGLKPRHENQLAFWGFKFIPEEDKFICTPDTPIELVINPTTKLNLNIY